MNMSNWGNSRKRMTFSKPGNMNPNRELAEDTPETPLPKLYYTIGEVSAMFGVNASLIRFWEKEFDIIKPRKNAKGNRLFTQQDIDHIALIHYYVKERRLTLEGVRQKIKENRNDAEHTFRIVQSLKKVRAMLLEIKNNISETNADDMDPADSHWFF